jgi:hypothetical protein
MVDPVTALIPWRLASAHSPRSSSLTSLTITHPSCLSDPLTKLQPKSIERTPQSSTSRTWEPFSFSHKISLCDTTVLHIMATPSPTLHLLALPRELRDRIYSFLTHEFVLRDAGEVIVSETHEPEIPSYHDPDSVALNAIQTTITLENAPHLDVMLVNSQIHLEYLETCLQKLSAIVRCEETYKVFEKSVHSTPSHQS